jgi:hypothetical protein
MRSQDRDTRRDKVVSRTADTTSERERGTNQMKVRAYIEFEFDTNDTELELNSIEELENYAIGCMVDDIYTMVKYNELTEAVRVEVIEEASV